MLPKIHNQRMWNNFKEPRKGLFCDRPLCGKKDDKVRESFHKKGKLRRAAHANCYLKAKRAYSSRVPKALHKLTKLNSHSYIKQYHSFIIYKNLVDRKNLFFSFFNFIPKTDERFLFIIHGLLRLIDYVKLTKKSVDTIVEALGTDKKHLQEKFILTKNFLKLIECVWWKHGFNFFT